ncbi:uncharacterized protein [Dysidea avara]|uniref:uncharacterized protein n=1 Tax=Dysidea avara TaxID=196820 RepID=UPI003316E82A
MKYFILLLLFASTLANEDNTLGMSKDNPATSCQEIYQHNPTSRGSVGQYWIKTSEGSYEVTCNMKLKCDGVEGGWMRAVDVDMNRDDSCPGTWHKVTTPRRLCLGNDSGCSSSHYHVKGIDYQHICGQAKGYQKGSTDAYQSKMQSIDGAYVDGISITLGSPRKHVWTYAAGLSDDYNYPNFNCPCATHPGPPPPAFVGNHYYCESGDVGEYYDGTPYYLSDPLWDGDGCGTGNGCCAQIGMPWFYRKLPVPVAEDFEVRICKNGHNMDEDIAVEKLEIYIK